MSYVNYREVLKSKTDDASREGVFDLLRSGRPEGLPGIFFVSKRIFAATFVATALNFRWVNSKYAMAWPTETSSSMARSD
jgi:hypothetical protein